MIFTGIPDIRYLWSTHERFLSQFQDGKLNKFKPFSTLPLIYKDISFYTPPNWNENELFEIIRHDNIKEVKCIDTFGTSKTYRITYLSLDPNMKDIAEFNKLANEIQDTIRNNLKDKVSLR